MWETKKERKRQWRTRGTHNVWNLKCVSLFKGVVWHFGAYAYLLSCLELDENNNIETLMSALQTWICSQQRVAYLSVNTGKVKTACLAYHKDMTLVSIFSSSSWQESEEVYFKGVKVKKNKLLHKVTDFDCRGLCQNKNLTEPWSGCTPDKNLLQWIPVSATTTWYCWW